MNKSENMLKYIQEIGPFIHFIMFQESKMKKNAQEKLEAVAKPM